MTKPWPVSTALSAELLDATSTTAVGPEWSDLSGRAAEPNAFFSPALALAAFAHLPEGNGAALLAAWRGEGDTRRMVGALPLVLPRGRYWNPAPMRRAASCYGTVSTPLIDPDRPAETLRAMLAALDAAGIGSVLLPFLREDGAVAQALRELSREAAIPVVQPEGHARAFLDSPLPGAAYLRATLEPRRRKEADRQRRRLADEGAVAFSIATGPDEVPPALERFLDLEAAGWKGQAGTALNLAPGAAAFIREAASRGARDGTFRVATLTCGERPVAAGIVLVSGRRAFYAKTAYDEALARFSPGLLLTLDLTAALLDDPSIDDADSIAVADHPMIDRIWTERLPVAAFLVGTRPGRGPAFRAAAAIEQAREAAVGIAKTRIAQLRGFRKPAAKDATKKAAAIASA